MNKQEDIELIEAYLNGALLENERQAVERRLDKDEAFRQEMTFQQQMHEHFWDEKRQHFRALLQNVVEDHSYPPATKPPIRSWWMWLTGLLVAGGLLLWYWQHGGHAPQNRSNETPLPTKQEPEQQIIAPPAEDLKQQPTVVSPPMATVDQANFAPNPSMEYYVDGVNMGENMGFIDVSPRNDATFMPDKKGVSDLFFAGNADGVTEDDPVSYTLSIYNNRKINKPAVTIPVELQKTEGRFRFEIRHPFKAKNGRYYFTLENNTGERVYTGKFFIGRPAQ